MKVRKSFFVLTFLMIMAIFVKLKFRRKVNIFCAYFMTVTVKIRDLPEIRN